MKASLADQIAFLQRTVNPNYIIIIKNKASEDMDFSTFKPVIPEEPVKKIKENTKDRYKIIVANLETKDENGNMEINHVLITVKDLFYQKDCFHAKVKFKAKESIVKDLKKMYKGSSLEDVI